MKKRQRFEYLLAALVIIVLFVGSIFFTNYFFKKELIAQQETYLEKKARLLSEQLSVDSFNTHSLTEAQQELVGHYATEENERITLMDNKAVIFFDTSDETLRESRANRPEVQAILAGSKLGSSLRTSVTVNKELLYVTIPFYQGKQLQGIIRIAEETSLFATNIQNFKRYILITLSILFLIITASIFLLLHQKNKPFLTVLPVLKKIVKHPDEARSIIQDSPEWNELYQTVNSLSLQMSETYLAYTSTDEQFHALVDELMIGVFIIDIDGKLQLMNPKMSDILGIKDFIRDNDYFDVIEEPALIHLIHQITSDKGVLHQEITLDRQENEVILDVSLRFIEETGNRYQVLGIAYDLTRVRQLEKMQKDFVSNVSHELKTPVTSLLGFTETLLDGAKDDPDTLTQFLEIIQKDATRLQQLIQEILQLSKGEKELAYDNQEIQLYDFTCEIVNSYKKLITEKKLTLEISGDKQATFITKYELFYPVVKNLIENAIQYSADNSTITVGFFINELLIFTVKDSGLGISLEDQERIFERFYRVDKARSRHSGGTGLGLSIVQNYTELLGGSVYLDSHLGLGSTFTIELPFINKK